MTTAVDLHSGSYVERYNQKSLTRVRKLVERMQIGNDDVVVDFGCGNGMLLQAMGTRKGSYIGVDFSQDFIDSANAWADRSGLSNYEFHCSLIADFCNEHPSICDVATTLDLSEHVADDEAVEIYRSIHRSMKPKAKLYIHTPNATFFLEALKERGVLRQFPEHIAVRTGQEMVRLLEKAGFRADGIRVQTIPHYNVLRTVDPLKHLPGIGPWFAARLWIEARA